jgi:hypothetical protein
MIMQLGCIFSPTNEFDSVSWRCVVLDREARRIETGLITPLASPIGDGEAEPDDDAILQ